MKTPFLMIAALIGTAGLAQTPAANGSAVPEGPNTPAQTTEQAATPEPTAAPASAATTDAMPATSSTTTASVDTSNYPACSRGVMDKCVQRSGMHRQRPHR